MANKIIEVKIGDQRWIGVADESISDLQLINALTTVKISKYTLTEAKGKKVQVYDELR